MIPFVLPRILTNMSEPEDWGTATWRYWQEVLNRLPARDLPDRPAVSVRARLVWARDGVEWVDGEARRLDPGVAIYVELRDRRCNTLGVWLSPDDVWWPGR